jgi:hypothetical protein
MKRRLLRSIAIAVTFVLPVFAVSAGAQSLIIYPAKGQSAEQQSKDEGECNAWAKTNTGIDPVALASAASQPAPVAEAPGTPPQQGGQRVRSAAKGAAVGAAVGAIAGDAGAGAAGGAVVGTAAGGAKKRKAQRQAVAEQQQAQQQAQATANAQAADTQQKLATYNKAYSACLEGRGYSVK